MKRALLVLVGAAALVAAGSVSAAVTPVSHTNPELVIRHIKAGCHTWELGQVRAGPAHTIRVYVGHSLSIVNRDAVDHTLVQTSGPTTVPATLLAHRGASTPLLFLVPGTYTFQTKEPVHKPYMLDARDVPDHTLTLKVVVASEYL